VGEITLDGKAYRAALSDDRNRGDFRRRLTRSNRRDAAIGCEWKWKVDYDVERFAVGKPFNIGGKSYIRDGTSTPPEAKCASSISRGGRRTQIAGGRGHGADVHRESHNR